MYNKTTKIMKYTELRKLIREELEKIKEEGYLTFDGLPDCVKEKYKNNITMSVAFVKKDGSVRHMAFRRNLLKYEKSEAEKTEKQMNVLRNNNLFLVYDVNLFIKAKKELGDDAEAAKKCYRRIKLDSIMGFLCGGKFYDMRDQNKIKERFGDEVYDQLTQSMINKMKSDS